MRRQRHAERRTKNENVGFGASGASCVLRSPFYVLRFAFSVRFLLAELGQTFLDRLHLGLQVSQVCFQASEFLCLRLKSAPESKTLAVSAATVAAALVPAATVACALALFLAPATALSVVVM